MSNTYPYAQAAVDGFLMQTDHMPWFTGQPRRTRNAFLMHCLSGSAEVIRDMETFVFEQDMEWTLLPNCTFQILHPTADFRVRYCVCSPPLFDEITHNIPTQFIDYLVEEGPYKMHEAIDYEANQLYFGMLQLVHNDAGNIHRRQIAANTMQSYFFDIHDKDRLRLPLAPKTHGLGDALIKKFWKLVPQHYLQHKEVSWYANQLCVSTRYLSQIFREILDTTPKEAIDDYVVLEIKIELRSTNDSIQQIADRLNFADQSTMGRFFQRKTGMTPTDYRKQA